MEHGFSEMAGAQALGLTGAMSIVGTIGSGWICDRFGRKAPLALYYFIRGLSLLFLTVVRDVPSLLLFAVVAGAFLPLHAGINARIAHFVGGAVRASAISFFIGTVVLLF